MEYVNRYQPLPPSPYNSLIFSWLWLNPMTQLRFVVYALACRPDSKKSFPLPLLSVGRRIAINQLNTTIFYILFAPYR